MPSCVVKVCKNHSSMERNDQAITFHRFPTSNKVWRKQLIDVIQISRDDKNWKPSKYSVICSIHFDASDLYFTKGGLAKLVDLALPTKFLFAPLSVTYIQHLEPAVPNTTPLQPATVQVICPQAPESLPKKPKEPCASPLEMLSEIPSGAVIIARVYKYLQKEYEELKARSGDAPILSSLGDILGRTAAATGLNQRFVSIALEVDALKTNEGKRSAKPEVGERKRSKYNSEEDVSPMEEESDDDDGDSASQVEPCRQENGEEGVKETLKLEFYEDDDYDVYAVTNSVKKISRLQENGSIEASSATQNLMATTVSRIQDVEVTKPATCSSADPITDTAHAVKEEIPDDEYRIASSSIQNHQKSTVSKTEDGEVTKPATCSSAVPITDTAHTVKEEIPDDEYRMSKPQVCPRTYSRHETPGKPRVGVKVVPIDEHSHTMSQPNKIIAAVPVIRTLGGSVEVPDPKVNILLKASPGQLRVWRPSILRAATPKRVASPKCPGPLPKRSRHSLLEDCDIEPLIKCPDSEGELDESSDDDEDLIMGDVGSNMRLVARKLREFNVYREEGQSDAMQYFLEKEGLGIKELLADVDGISDGAVGTAAGGIVAASGGGGTGEDGGDSGAGGSGAATEADGAAVGDVIAGPRDLNRFSWSEDFSTFSGHQEVYLNSPGPQVQSDQPADLFTQVWDLPIITHIVEQTNNYAWRTIGKLSEDGRLKKYLDAWEETTVEEIYRLFGLLNYMSICYRSRVDEYWTTDALGMPEFTSIMTRNRFRMLMRFLRFDDNDTIEIRPYNKKISKIEPIITHCNNKFCSMYTPQQTLSLDESLFLWKSRFSWMQCTESKAARFGLKSFELSEASSGYLLRSLLYTGKHCTMTQGAIHGFESPTAKVVLKLMDGYLDRGHTLVIDNWYSQLSLTRYLKHRHTDVVGTMSRCRAHVPLAIKCANGRRMQRGQQHVQHCGDITIVAWKDLKLVTATSTFHNAEQVRVRRAGEVFNKPKLIEYYNKNRGDGDLKDQKLSAYHFERKRGMKWYLKVFSRLLNTSLLNTFIIYSKSPSENMLSHRQFRYKVSEGLLIKYQKRVILPCLTGPPGANPVRLDRSQDHFIINTEKSRRTGNYSRRRCARCSSLGVRIQVAQLCSACNVALCIGKCWLEYHTLEKL